MSYELFIGWRYLYAQKRSAMLWVSLGITLLIFCLGFALFFFTAFKATGVVALIVGGVGVAASFMMMFFSTFTAISIIGLAVGVSFLIWVLSVTGGFQDEFRRKVLGVNGHILVMKYGLDFVEYRDVMKTCEAIPGVAAAEPFVFNEMMLSRANRLSSVHIKGVDPQRVGKVLDLPRQIISPKDIDAATFPTLLGQSLKKDRAQLPGILIGKELAHKLKAKVGDPVRLISPLSGLDVAGWSASGEIPRSKDFRVAGIFFSGFDEFDRKLIYLHLHDAQSFYNHGDAVSGIELKIDDIFQAKKLSNIIYDKLGGMPYRTIDWGGLNKNIFLALAIQKLILQILIGFIVIVAAFNVLAALAVLVIRKTREIAVLKSIGTSAWGVARVFQSGGIIIWFVGTSLGLLWGYLGGLLLKTYGFPLDPRVYLISKLPVKIDGWDFVFTALFAFIVCTFATLYPAIRAARLDPVRGLRNE